MEEAPLQLVVSGCSRILNPDRVSLQCSEYLLQSCHQIHLTGFGTRPKDPAAWGGSARDGPAVLMEGVDGPKDATNMIYIFTVLIQQARALASGAAIEEGYCQHGWCLPWPPP